MQHANARPVAARPEWIEVLVDLKLATSFGHAQIGANVVHRLLVDGTYRRHVDSLRARLADAMGETLRRVTRAGLRIWTEPRGGVRMRASHRIHAGE